MSLHKNLSVKFKVSYQRSKEKRAWAYFLGGTPGVT